MRFTAIAVFFCLACIWAQPKTVKVKIHSSKSVSGFDAGLALDQKDQIILYPFIAIQYRDSWVKVRNPQFLRKGVVPPEGFSVPCDQRIAPALRSRFSCWLWKEKR